MMSNTQLQDLPDVILTIIFTLVKATRARNAMALVCRKWLALERSTRTSLSLRANVRDLYLIPTSFRAITHLDLSLVSPWGHSIFLDNTSATATSSSSSSSSSSNSNSNSSSHHYPPHPIAHRLAQAFTSLISLTIYARTPSTLLNLAPLFPRLRHVKLVRWHQRFSAPLGSDFVSLFKWCPSISSLDLSHFYCWTEDLPTALQAYPATAASLTHLNLLTLSVEGFKSHELIAISQACPKLQHLLAACMFDPRYVDFVGDDALRALATNCPFLTLLHLADASSLSGARANGEGFSPEDARISRLTLEEVFGSLPQLQELTLDVCQNVRDAGPALETLSFKCPQLKSLALGQFHGICRADEWQLDGVALCGGLVSLSINNSGDLTDSSLHAISRGCQKLTKFAIQGCKNVTELGMTRLTGMLRKTLVDVSISCCRKLDTAATLRALEPIRDRIQRLHMDCIWDGIEQSSSTTTTTTTSNNYSYILSDIDLNEFRLEELEARLSAAFGCSSSAANKRCRYSGAEDCSGSGSSGSWNNGNGYGFWSKTWKRLRYLSLWIAVGELLSPLPMAGLENCPELEEVRIKVEGDCRRRPKPTQTEFGLSCLARYPRLHKMQLDCGDTIGYALTAPSGHMDLSLWERFFLLGIGTLLSLDDLDYWPPQDREVNNRSLTLPAAGLLRECVRLRKLFIHGTAHEHFMMFLPHIPNLRDVQLREDYYPAPENEMSTEMRVDSCSRFEDALNRRLIDD
ncbi:hypothetical protein MRB53_019920 [Persea americana]|uniref:Uncharacterized protein n=1 Tax=Persea americana TaxID=3435 RepID=A0ACC2KZT7_PERAE|nr:hypothetical protein MRB53_019920 [Persea americana]